MKWFNTGGPCVPEDHYMLPAVERLAAYDLHRLIAQRGYFVVHAPRQTGKTTAMMALARELTDSGKYISIVLSLEVGVPFANEPEKAMNAIINNWQSTIRAQLRSEFHPEDWMTERYSGNLINNFLAEWSSSASRPLVI